MTGEGIQLGERTQPLYLPLNEKLQKIENAQETSRFGKVACEVFKTMDSNNLAEIAINKDRIQSLQTNLYKKSSGWFFYGTARRIERFLAYFGKEVSLGGLEYEAQEIAKKLLDREQTLEAALEAASNPREGTVFDLKFSRCSIPDTMEFDIPELPQKSPNPTAENRASPSGIEEPSIEETTDASQASYTSNLKKEIASLGGHLSNLRLKESSIDDEGNFKAKLSGTIESQYSNALISGHFKGDSQENINIRESLSDDEKSILNREDSEPSPILQSAACIGEFDFIITGNEKTGSQSIEIKCTKENPHLNDWEEVKRQEALQTEIDELRLSEVVRVSMNPLLFPKELKNEKYDVLHNSLQTRNLKPNLSVPDDMTRSEAIGFLSSLEGIMTTIQTMQEKDLDTFSSLDGEKLHEGLEKTKALYKKVVENNWNIQEIQYLANELTFLEELDRTPFYRRCAALDIKQSLADFNRNFKFNINGTIIQKSALEEELQNITPEGIDSLGEQLSLFHTTEEGKDLLKIDSSDDKARISLVSLDEQKTSSDFLHSEDFSKAMDFLGSERYKLYLKNDTKTLTNNENSIVLNDEESRLFELIRSLESDIYFMRLSQAIDTAFDCSSTKNPEKKVKAISLLHQGISAEVAKELKAAGGTQSQEVSGLGGISIDQNGLVKTTYTTNIIDPYAFKIAIGEFSQDEGITELLNEREAFRHGNGLSIKDAESIASMGTFKISVEANVFQDTFNIRLSQEEENPHFKDWDYNLD